MKKGKKFYGEKPIFGNIHNNKIIKLPNSFTKKTSTVLAKNSYFYGQNELVKNFRGAILPTAQKVGMRFDYFPEKFE